MGKSIYDLRQLPVVGQSGFAAGVNVTALVGVVATANLPSYASYTPVWTSSGTAVAIGNATVVGRWIQVGELVHCYGSITFGSSSTFGTGTYKFSLPVNCSTNHSTTAADALGVGRLFDTSASALGHGVARAATASTFGISYGATYLGTSTDVGQLAPWTWAQSDTINWNIVYEVV